MKQERGASLESKVWPHAFHFDNKKSIFLTDESASFLFHQRKRSVLVGATETNTSAMK